jgi:alkylation response protein AidB-like acyl-CoA dehydrogenase
MPRKVSGKRSVADATIQRQAGLIDTRLRVAAWAHDGALAIVGDDPEPSMDTVVAVMAAEREIALAGIEVCDLAMDVAGGGAYYKTSPIEQCYRDVRGGKFHPLGPEESLVHAG